MFVKKRKPGGSSHGYQWPKAGVRVVMPAGHAHELVTIQPDEFEAQPELPRGAKVYKADADSGDGSGGSGVLSEFSLNRVPVPSADGPMVGSSGAFPCGSFSCPACSAKRAAAYCAS